MLYSINYYFFRFLMKEHKLISAIIKRDNNIVKQLLSNGENPNLREKSVERHFPALTVALMHDNIKAADFLLTAKADINGKDANSRTPLINLISSEKTTSLTWLLGKPNFDIDAMDKIGQTALMHAARLGNPGFIKILIEHGADVNLISQPNKFQFKRTALTYAVLYGKNGKTGGSPESCLQLLEAGADINHRNENNFHFWELTACSPEIRKLLLSYKEHQEMVSKIATHNDQNNLLLF